MLTKFIPWQETIIWSGVIGILITLLLIIVVKDTPYSKTKTQEKYQNKDLQNLSESEWNKIKLEEGFGVWSSLKKKGSGCGCALG